MTRWAAVLILLVFAATVAAQSPSQIDAELDVSGMAQLQGELALSAHVAGTEMFPTLTSAFHADVHDAVIRVANVPYQVVGTTPASVVGKSSGVVTHEPELLWEAKITGRIALQEAGGPESVIRLMPLDDPWVRPIENSRLEIQAASFAITPPAPDHTVLSPYALTPIENRRLNLEGVHGPIKADTSVSNDSVFAVLYGGDFTLDGTHSTRIETGHRLNESASVQDPAGQGGVWQYDRIVLIVEAAGASVHMEAGDGKLTHYVRSLSGTARADVALHGAAGRIQADDWQGSGRFALAQFIGNFTLDAQYGEVSSWTLSGPAEFMAIDGAGVLGERPAGTGLSVEAAAASVLLLIAYAVISVIRRGFVWTAAKFLQYRWLLAAALFTRITKEAALEHPVRRRVMELLDGPLAMAELSTLKMAVSRDLGVSVKIVHRHVQRLYTVGYVDLLYDRSRIHVGRNGGALGDMATKVAARIVQDETGRAVAGRIMERPGTTPKELIDSLAGSLKVSPGTVKYWVGKLRSFRADAPAGASRTFQGSPPGGHRGQEVRLVHEQRQGRLVRLYATAPLLVVLKAHRADPSSFGRNIAASVRATTRRGPRALHERQ